MLNLLQILEKQQVPNSSLPLECLELQMLKSRFQNDATSNSLPKLPYLTPAHVHSKTPLLRLLRGPEDILHVGVVVGVLDFLAHSYQKHLNLDRLHPQHLERPRTDGREKRLEDELEVQADQAQSLVLGAKVRQH